MAFGKNGKNDSDGSDTLVADAPVDSTDATATDEAKAKPEPVVIPEGFVKIVDFAAELTFTRVAAKAAAGQAPSNDEDYVSVNEVYGWINAGMPNGHFGEGKHGKRVQRVEALAWLETYTPAKRGRAVMDDATKVDRQLAKILEAAKKLGISVEDLKSKMV
jgi:hypothetical protein